ncbi:Hsp90 cochaperone [Serendipita sp. 399]|nr:Hsp90 cochaperone [Serendipita sp. 399]
MAELLKQKGNAAFAAKEWDSAIDLFGQAIALDPSNHVLYSNRSAAYAGKKDWDNALVDADKCVSLNPKWSKGYVRKGAALHGARKYDDAIAAYEEGLKVEDTPALKKGLEEVRQAKDADEAEGAASGLGKIFQDPGMWAKLAANPKTAPLLQDPQFAAQLRMMQANPQLAGNAFNDPRMISVLGVLMGIDMQGFAREEGSDELPPGLRKDTSPPKPTPASSSSTGGASTSKPAPAPPAPDVKMAEPEPEPEDEDDEEAVAKKTALAEKAKGNESYKKRDFDAAIESFKKAWEAWPKDITFLTNMGAAQYEKGDYDAAIATCETAVEEARSIRADYKLVAKALGRIGSAYLKKEDYDNAIKYLQKSLTEHRTPDILNKLRDTEKLKKTEEARKYVNPELAEKAREEGNAKFKAGQFADSVALYTEAIKRDPNDPRGYNNRAAAYTKLAALPEALKDAEEAIKVDPTFVKGHIRKSLVLFSMKEYTKAMEAAQVAQDTDVDKKHAREIDDQMQKISVAMYTERAGETEEQTLQRAMRDPEVASIMQDPVINQILQQAQQNPAALQDHMRNPVTTAFGHDWCVFTACLVLSSGYIDSLGAGWEPVALVAIFFAYFGNWLIPQSAFSRIVAEMAVAFVSLTALTLFIIAHHRRGKGRVMNQTQEEVVLIGIFALFWFAFLIGLRAWNDRHAGRVKQPTPSETVWDFTQAPFQKESEAVRACIKGRMMCVVDDNRIISVRSSR